MNKRTLLALTAALTLTAAPALAGGNDMMMMAPGMSTAQTTNNTDVLFMETATISNLTEIQTSQLALQKSSNTAVRAYAQRMISEHTKAQAELNTLAASKGIKLTDKPGAPQRLQYNKLSTLSGAAFDAMYKMVQVGGHQMTLDLIKTYRSFGRDAQALAYAAKIQPAVEMHLMDAKALPGM
jgi:putative membrane protein